jgi:hypothetical protein
MSNPGQYWFAAKRYGWGWGLPLCWQGWVVLGVWLVLMIAAAMRLMPAHPLPFLVFTLLMAALLGLICELTGEPPHWRWGD